VPGIHPLAVEPPPGCTIEDLPRLNVPSWPITASGQRVRFVAPADDGEGYEQRIWRTGEVASRPGNQHDFCNALIWLNFPRTKAVINGRHVAAATALPAGRGSERDALTHFDECGAIVVSRRHDLLELLRQFRWRALFCEHRDDVVADMALVVFGHATLEALPRPFRGLTAKAVLAPVASEWFEQDVVVRIADLDRRLAARFAVTSGLRPRDFQPLPLPGWPGVMADSEDPAYYDDTWQFRPGRRIAGSALAV